MPYVWLCLSAFGAGAVNAIAGGGTLLTFPALTAVIGAAEANATSTVALLPGSFGSAWGFRTELRDCRRWALLLFAPCLLGGALGAALVEERSFRRLIPWLILTASLLFLVQPLVARCVRARPAGSPPSLLAAAGIVLVQFLIAIYGGYFGAGIGILMLSSLAFLGLPSIHHVNALKNVLALGINGMASLVFLLKGIVVWYYAPPMAVAAVLGGYTAARLSRRLPSPLVRGIVIVIGFTLSAYYFARNQGS